MPTVYASPMPEMQFNQGGIPLSGGKLYTYQSGTTTKATTYLDSLGVTPNTNPIILDTNGQCSVWLDPTKNYKFTLAPATDSDPPSNPYWTQDNISGGASMALLASSVGAGLIGNTPAGNIASTTVQAALNELDTKKVSLVQAAASNGSSLIGFIQAGAGAVGRTVQSKEREWKTPYDFGAIGNGPSDDLVALNTALLAIGSGTLYFPTGCICGISATLSIVNNNVNLVFADWSAGIKPLAAMTNLISVTGDGCKIINGNIANNASFATNGISRSGTSNFGITIEGNYIASFANGIAYSASGNAGIFASNNFFNAQTNANIYYTEDGRNSQISQNYFNGGKYGLYSTFTTQQLEGLIFSGNIVMPTVAGGGCIYCNGGLYWAITGNVLDAGAAGVNLDFEAGTVTHQITYIVIEDNHIGIQPSSDGLKTFQNCSYFKIKDNTFDGQAASVGMDLSGLTFSRIVDNEFVNMTGTQISCTNACTYNNFIGNQLRGTGVTALEDSASQNIWFGNYGTVNTKSPKSFFLYNWTDDVLAAESDWTAYTPTVTPTGGAITYTAVGAYRRLGKTIEFTCTITFTANTGTGNLLVTLPAVAAATYSQVVNGQQYIPAVYTVQGLTNTSAASMFVSKYDGTYPASAANSVIAISGVYKAA
jgi:hypothetical protein